MITKYGIGVEITKNVSLAPFTTYRIGGKAKYFVCVKSLDQLRYVLHLAQQESVPYFVLGNGSKILVSDNGFPGIVVKLAGDFESVFFDNDFVRVGAGVKLPRLCKQLLDRQWAGFEYMCDIPGTIGGATIMNAGTKDGEVKDTVMKVETIKPNGDVRLLSRKDIKFAYRQCSLLGKRDIILWVYMSIKYKDTRRAIKARTQRIMRERKAKQPREFGNCGSIFKSVPASKPVWWYIDACGLKGMRIGGAQVAPKHANWIVNLGDATAHDVRMLVAYVQDQVQRKFGHMLEREVIYVPEDIAAV